MIVFLGDVALLNNNYKRYYMPRFPYIFNLEYVIGDDKHLKPTCGKVNLISKDYDFDTYFGKNPAAVIISNNHTMDYGDEGLESTKRSLNAKQIGIIDANLYWYNKQTCMMAYTCVGGIHNKKDVFAFTKEKCQTNIKIAMEKGAKTIIVFMHWGVENQQYASREQIELGHWLIDNGVSLVVGNHPHCIQPIEIYKGKAICFSLGNCFFPNHHLNSHFDVNNIPHRRWHTKWCSWNNESIAIIFDEEKGIVHGVEYLFTDKFGLHKKIETSIENLKPTKINKFKSMYRKYALFFYSNMFVEGKIAEVSAFKNEICNKLKGM